MITFVKEKEVTLVKKNSVKRKPTCKTLNEVGIEIKLRGDIGYRPVNATNGTPFFWYYLADAKNNVLILD